MTAERCLFFGFEDEPTATASMEPRFGDRGTVLSTPKKEGSTGAGFNGAAVR